MATAAARVGRSGVRKARCAQSARYALRSALSMSAGLRDTQASPCPPAPVKRIWGQAGQSAGPTCPARTLAWQACVGSSARQEEGDKAMLVFCPS